MSNILPDNRSSALVARRSVLIGLATSLLPAPAIVVACNIMPVRRAPITEPGRICMGFVDRLRFDSLAVDSLRGYGTGSRAHLPLSDVERSVRCALKNGWLSPTRADQIRFILQDGEMARSVEGQPAERGRKRLPFCSTGDGDDPGARAFMLARP